ncbi:hypothetical protein ACLOJK_015558 [Asimina triloba]
MKKTSCCLNMLVYLFVYFCVKALLSGCSAGGLATFLHCDEFTGFLPRTARVKCLSDAGFFLDVISFSPPDYVLTISRQDIVGNHTMRSFYDSLVYLQGIELSLNTNCTKSLYFPTLCFFPQYALPYIQTPYFILNSAYDVYQVNTAFQKLMFLQVAEVLSGLHV